MTLVRYAETKREHGHNLRKSTAKLAGKFVIDKDKRHFRKRVEEQFEGISKLKSVNKDELVVWNITHSLVIKHVARSNKKKFQKHVEFLDHLALKKK